LHKWPLNKLRKFFVLHVGPPGKRGGFRGVRRPPLRTPAHRASPPREEIFQENLRWGEFEAGQPGRSPSEFFCFLQPNTTACTAPFQTRIGVDNRALNFSEHNGLGGSYDQLQGSGRATLSFSCASSSAPI